jgi:hypothetical protein
LFASCGGICGGHEDRKIEDKKMGYDFIFPSSIFLSAFPVRLRFATLCPSVVFWGVLECFGGQNGTETACKSQVLGLGWVSRNCPGGSKIGPDRGAKNS